MEFQRQKMRCIHFTIRSKKYIKYQYCRKQDIEVCNTTCSKCLFKEYPKYKTLKKKSNKLANLERKRKSILTDDLKTCYLCGKRAVHMHEIFGGCNRVPSMKEKFCVPLCFDCHKAADEQAEIRDCLQKKCQKEYEKNHTREEFMKITGRNYL